MQIDFVRSGGFAGIRLTVNVDTRQIPADQGSSLETLVQQADFFNLPEQIVSLTPGVDRYVYSLTINSDQGKHTVVASETVVPEKLRPLLDYLTTMAMNTKK